jgi:hypothetical protein
MRRLSFLIASAALLAAPAVSPAQVQRMMLEIGESIARAGSDAIVRALCVDLGRKAPEASTAFRHSYGDPGSVVISYKGKDYSISEASAAGIGDFVGLGDGDFDGVRFRSHVNGDVHVKVNKPTLLSENDERMPQAKLNSLSGAVKANPDQEDTWTRSDRMDEQILLRDLGLYSGAIDGIAGPQYRKAVDAFKDKTDRPAKVDEMIQYAAESGVTLGPDSRLIAAASLRNRLADVGFRGDGAAEQFRRYHKLTSANLTDPAFLRQLNADEQVSDLLMPQDGSVSLAPGEGGIEAWVYKGDRVESRHRGTEAIAASNRGAGAMVRGASEKGTSYLYTGAYRKNSGTVDFQVGATTVSESRASVESFLGGNGGLPKVESALSALPPAAHGKRPSVIIYRGGAYAGRSNQLLLAGIDDLGFAQVDPVKLASSFQSRYGDRVNVFLASDTQVAQDHLASIPQVRRPADLAVLKGEKIEDWGATENIESALKRAGIPLLEGHTSAFQAGNVVIFTGHRDANFMDYITKLNDEGALRNKLVVLFSCYEAACDIRQSALLKSFMGPVGIVFFPGEVNANAISLVLTELSGLTARADFSPGTLPEILSRSVDAALAKAPPELRPEVVKLRSLILQLSELIIPQRSKEA